MKIAMIGAGNVGQALGNQFATLGHDVSYGVRDPQAEKYQALAQVKSLAEAVQDAELVVLATPWSAAVETVQSLDLAGKILVDCTNPLKPMLAGLALGTETSGAEELAKLTSAKVVKAFNTTGAENMAQPQYGERHVFMPVCSDDTEAGQAVAALASEIGFDGRYIGPLSCARYLEPYAMVWIHMAIKGGFGRNFALGLLER